MHVSTAQESNFMRMCADDGAFFSPLSEVHDVLCNEGSAIARRRFGGKACHLARLAHAGFRVPDSFVISTQAFDALMDEILRGQSDLSNPQKILQTVTFPEPFVNALRRRYEEFAQFSLAIRSSSTDEDSAEHSFAGMQHSILGVESFSAFLAALRTVWRSFYAHERLLYPIQTQPSHPVPSMAVIVQRYVPATCSGVIFTQNPVNQKRHTMLLNVARGSGMVVAGNESVESFSLDRQELCDAQDFILHYQKLPNPALSLEQLRQLGTAALQIEELYRKAQDIEFCFLGEKLTILQTRPIVNGADKECVPRELFSNVNVGEALSDAVTPMTWSVGMDFARLGFETIFKSLGLSVPAHYGLVTTFHGRIYLNASQFFSILTQIPFIDVKRLGKSVGIPNVAEFDFDITMLPPWALIRALPKTLWELVGTQYKILFKLKPWAKAFLSQRDGFLQTDFASLSHSDLRRSHQQLQGIFNECGQAMLIAASSFLFSYQLISALLSRVTSKDEAQGLEAALFGGLCNVRSADPGLALLQMAQGLLKQKSIRDRFVQPSALGNAKAFLRELEDLPEARPFLDAFGEFMQKYGLRTTQEAELATPRWNEDPQFLLQVIQAHLLSEGGKDPGLLQGLAAQQRQHITHHTQTTLFKHSSRFFKYALAMAQKGARLREEWRAYVVDSLGLYRVFLLECGKRLLAQGKVVQIDDVFYLSLPEIRAWLEDERLCTDALRTVAFRRAQHLAFKATPRMPDTFVLHPGATKIKSAGIQHSLRGIPACTGCVQATARVLHSPQEGAKTLKHGEILVARYTDVGWTPLFLLASALLTQQGGPLSHSCVVAREYGLPTIVAIPGLLDNVQTGDTLHLCADTGIVHIIKRANERE